MKKTLLLFILTLSMGLNAFAYLPSVKNKLTVVNNGPAKTNYKLLVTFAGSSYITSGNLLPNFNDVRFSEQPTCPTVFLNHYVERIVSGTGTMWVALPTLPAGNKEIYMYFGDATAPSGSNFNAVFPSAYIAPIATTTLSGVQNYDWFEVPLGATINLTQNDILTVNASRIKISGVINGVGKGYTGVSANFSTGNGPGGGGFSPAPSNAGSAGGSYAGIGGTGGYDFPNSAGIIDVPGVGGATYGTSTGTDVDFGSAGGSGNFNAFGGNGGGAVILNAKVQTSVSGTISVAGGAAITPANSSMGAGGGAGGCILITGDFIDLNGGTLNASGGAGSNFPTSPSTAKDGGGGGGGGRIKIRYGKSITNVGATNLVSGGIGGNNGDQAIGQNGGAGTSNISLVTPLTDFNIASLVTTISCWALPVEFKSFNVTKENKQVNVEWVTVNELNASHYEIERSSDAVKFVKIGEVSSLSLSQENQYSFDDLNPLAGVNFYRIKQVDNDAKHTYTSTKNVFMGEAGEIRIYPNPVTNNMTISIEGFKKSAQLKILNQVGQVVLSTSLKEANSIIDISSLASGIYFVNINNQVIKITKD